MRSKLCSRFCPCQHTKKKKVATATRTVFDKRTGIEYAVRATSQSEAITKVARRLKRAHGRDLR